MTDGMRLAGDSAEPGPESLLRGQARVLESIVSEASLEETLTLLVHVVETQHPGLLCTILLLDEDGIHVRHGAAPSLPPEFVKAIDGLPIGERAGSCGTAMFTGRPVIVTDILTDPLWADYLEFTAPTGLRASWSTPVRFKGGPVLGAFAMYYREARGPREDELALIDVAVNLAGVAINRKRTEEALRKSEANYRSLYSNSPVMMHSIDERGRLVSVSNRWLEVMGYSREEVLGRRSIDFLTPESARYAKETVLPEFYSSGKITEVPYQVIRKDGSVMDVLLSAIEERDEQGRFVRSMAVITDITNRKRMEEALLLSEERFRSLVENSSEVFFTTDAQGVLTYASPALEKVTGWAPHEAVGRSLLEFFPARDIPAVKESFARRMSGSLLTMEHRLLTRSGQVRWVRTSSRPMKDHERSKGLCAVMMDITSRKLAEEQLRQSQKMEAIGRLAGGIAHDFNNLLTAINGYSSLSLTLVDPSEPVHGYLAEILKSGERAAGLTRQLLAYSRKQILAPTVLNLNEIVSDMQDMLKRILGEEIHLVAALAPDLKAVMADRGQMEQVLLNLAVNARDAMPEGGRLILSTAYDSTGEGLPGPRPLGGGPGAVRLSVSDTGNGMPPEVQARLFEPFFTTKPAGKGTGLGLSVVYGIVKQSEGAIRVDSEPGKGTTFSVLLPEALGAAEEGGKPGAAPVTAGRVQGTELILLAEDEESVRNFARTALEAVGYRVLAAGNGLEALRQLEEYGDHIRLVIADMVMPEMGGDELAEQVKRLYPEMPLLYISGYQETVEREVRSEEHPAILWKPFKPDVLANKVRQMLDQAASLALRQD